MIIDGNSIINRAFFGLGQGGRLTAPDGTPTGAVYTFLNMFLRYFNEYQPTHICIAFPDKKMPLHDFIVEAAALLLCKKLYISHPVHSQS